MAPKRGLIDHNLSRTEKLSQMNELLTRAGEDSPGSVLSLANALFDRATDEFIKLRSPHELATIAERVALAYRAWAKASDQETVGRSKAVVTLSNASEYGTHCEYSSICSVLEDRPFIIASITNLLQSYDINIRCILHPILQHNSGALADTRVSVVYIEFEPQLHASEGEKLQQKLEIALADLLAITDHFSMMGNIASNLAGEINSGYQFHKFSRPDREEATEFMRWLVDDGFVFLGYRKWECPEKAGDLAHCLIGPAGCGLFDSANPDLVRQISAIDEDVRYLLQQPAILSISKVPMLSPLYRDEYLDLVLVKTISSDQKSFCVHAFLGIFSAAAVQQDSSKVPVIKQKLAKIIETEGFQPQSYAFKEIVYIVNSSPKSEMFWLPLATIIKNIDLVLSIEKQRRTRISLTADPLGRFLLAMVVMPSERFSDQVRLDIQHYLEDELGATRLSSEHKLAVGDGHLARIHFLLKPGSEELLYRALNSSERLEEKVSHITFTWQDRLRNELSKDYDLNTEVYLATKYNRLFSESYKAQTEATKAVKDIFYLEKLSEDNPLAIALQSSNQDNSAEYELKVYKAQADLALSSLVPILENFGFIILNETTTELAKDDDSKIGIYHLRMLTESSSALNESYIESVILPHLLLVLQGHASNDKLNSLSTFVGLSVKQVTLLRLLRQYLLQIKAFTGAMVFNRALVNNPHQTAILIQYFVTKFDPDLDMNLETRLSKLNELDEQLLSSLKQVQKLSDDTVIRRAANVLSSAVRTNYFINRNDLRISLKIECAKISKMPEPRPLFEIFVHSPCFEGVHLRAAKVARGGLRWSERPDDFRTEILGLMKTQVIKNSIIVPSGAKGGFVLLGRMAADPSPTTVKTCYQNFIRSLLEVTDNLDSSRVICPPPKVVRHDPDDPYFVVAADKGTATFSDVANNIAQAEFNFWLGDAFASGGSYGYDHKKLGITAKGAWECVKRHFAEMKRDILTNSFTAVGIGDLAGDVFGNGMILSDKLKLIAAFNHRHIFLDPDPDPAVSFQERLRLFNLPKSNWTDYNPELISNGGGIFDRSTKEIFISPQVQLALNIDKSSLSAEDLIKSILRAPVDLFWNGGIGTYVKATDEDNLAVGDRANDDVRIDATELRCAVVGEGGNLGFTQSARVEYALHGGRINTDALDNSAGVDLSDLEVNLKIMLSGAMHSGKLLQIDRDRIMRDYSTQAVTKITSHNREQSIAISLDHLRSQNFPLYFAEFITILEKRLSINRKADCLPDRKSLISRSAPHHGLTRPELAILLAHAKLQVFDQISKNNLLDLKLEDVAESNFWGSILLGYFPDTMVSRYRKDALSHPLRTEIIAAQVTNRIVNLMGATCVERIAAAENISDLDVIMALLAAYETLNCENLLSELEAINTPATQDRFLESLLLIANSLETMACWFIRARLPNQSWEQLGTTYAEILEQLIAQTIAEQPKPLLIVSQQTEQKYTSLGLSPSLAVKLANLPHLSSFLDIALITRETSSETKKVALTYFEANRELSLPQIFDDFSSLSGLERFQTIAFNRLLDSTRSHLRCIVMKALQAYQADDITISVFEEYIHEHEKQFARYHALLAELRNAPPSLASLFLLTEELANLT